MSSFKKLIIAENVLPFYLRPSVPNVFGALVIKSKLIAFSSGQSGIFSRIFNRITKLIQTLTFPTEISHFFLLATLPNNWQR